MLNGTQDVNFTRNALNTTILACIWHGTERQWFIINALGLSPGLMTVLCNTINLLVFYAWHRKEPYVLFHILLAVSSLMYGAMTAFVPLGRLALGVQGATVLHFGGLFATTVISVDRWLSVEFPHVYRVHATTPKVLAAIAAVCGITLLCTLPGAIIWRDCLTFHCFRAPTFESCTDSPALFVVLKDPIFLGVLFVCQCRIVWTAVRITLRRHRATVGVAIDTRRRTQRATVGVAMNTRRRTQRAIVGVAIDTRRRTAAGHDPAQRIGLVWKTLRPGMSIVAVTFMSIFPHWILALLKQAGVSNADRGDTSVLYLFWYIQHVTSPVIYVLFFRSYRTALGDICRETRRYCLKMVS
ncbi:hypothetical protein BV898_10448 [Hypsibius exemplaris]|uniref:G-protein coupled receptors family 1 profile domain-containing protein n=1 Tax=Hypsibius exemplaris TaxID=2072580 RepID=A0A1W0WJK8_HYPEX|nr:hypothetical protein BV898_10448 [Hypsibius exemplaris]